MRCSGGETASALCADRFGIRCPARPQVSMPMTFGMAMRFLAPWRTETPGPGQGKDEGGAPPPSRSRLQILSGIDDALDAPLLLLGLAHQRLHVDDPLTLLPRDLRPVVGEEG